MELAMLGEICAFRTNVLVSFRTGFAWQKFLELAAAAVWALIGI